VDAASHGDIIKVAAGTYNGVNVRPRNDFTTTGVVTQVVYISRTVAIRGGYTTTNAFADPPDPEANPTILDAQRQGRVLYITGDISPTVEGLRITGGKAAPDGGGVFAISATVIISNNRVFSNTADGEGGGLALWRGNATLSGNTVTANIANGAYGGGGVFLAENTAILDRNVITANTANIGGGIFLSGLATLVNNTIASNTAHSEGGGLLCMVGSTATLSGNMITANSAPTGGGLYVWASDDITLNGNAITANTADSGGGLYLWWSDDGVTLTNNVIADNQANVAGSGLYIWASSPRLLHTTIARNSGGDGSGIYVFGWGPNDWSIVTMTNTILVSHTVGITVTVGSTVTLEATLWGIGPWANGTDWGSTGNIITGTHNIWNSPAFVNPNAGDYHIGSDSAAIDAGVNAGVTLDIDNELRPTGLGYDIGADEFHPPSIHPVPPIYLPMLMSNYSS
jgi:hypothetical protein